jgi:hypothetical protein
LFGHIGREREIDDKSTEIKEFSSLISSKSNKKETANQTNSQREKSGNDNHMSVQKGSTEATKGKIFENDKTNSRNK